MWCQTSAEQVLRDLGRIPVYCRRMRRTSPTSTLLPSPTPTAGASGPRSRGQPAAELGQGFGAWVGGRPVRPRPRSELYEAMVGVRVANVSQTWRLPPSARRSPSGRLGCSAVRHDVPVARSRRPGPNRLVGLKPEWSFADPALQPAMNVDTLLKYLAEGYPDHLAAWLLGQPIDTLGRVEVLKSELGAEPIRADFVAILRDAGFILHVEFHYARPTAHAPPIGLRMLDYWVRLYRQYRLPIEQVLVLIKPPAVPVSGVFEVGHTRHEYRVVRLWEEDPAPLLADEALLPLAALARTGDRPALLSAVAARVRTIEPPERRQDIGALAQALGGVGEHVGGDQDHVRRRHPRRVSRLPRDPPPRRSQGAREGEARGRPGAGLKGRSSCCSGCWSRDSAPCRRKCRQRWTAARSRSCGSWRWWPPPASPWPLSPRPPRGLRRHAEPAGAGLARATPAPDAHPGPPMPTPAPQCPPRRKPGSIPQQPRTDRMFLPMRSDHSSRLGSRAPQVRPRSAPPPGCGQQEGPT